MTDMYGKSLMRKFPGPPATAVGAPDASLPREAHGSPNQGSELAFPCRKREGTGWGPQADSGLWGPPAAGTPARRHEAADGDRRPVRRPLSRGARQPFPGPGRSAQPAGRRRKPTGPIGRTPVAAALGAAGADRAPGAVPATGAVSGSGSVRDRTGAAGDRAVVPGPGSCAASRHRSPRQRGPERLVPGTGGPRSRGPRTLVPGTGGDRSPVPVPARRAGDFSPHCFPPQFPSILAYLFRGISFPAPLMEEPGLMSVSDGPDGARGALVENAIHYAEKGDSAQVLGILAGMSVDDQQRYGPMIVAFLPERTQAAVLAAITGPAIAPAAAAAIENRR